MSLYDQYVDEGLRLIAVLGLDPNRLPTQTQPYSGEFVRESNGVLHCYSSDHYYESLVGSGDVQDVLYHVFHSITFSMALDYECEHRCPNEDCRRQAFAHHESLMRRLNEDWAHSLAAEHAKILEKYPFNDAPRDYRPFWQAFFEDRIAKYF